MQQTENTEGKHYVSHGSPADSTSNTSDKSFKPEYFQTTTTTTKHVGALEPNVVYAVNSEFFVEQKADLEDKNRQHSMIKLQKYDTKSIEERFHQWLEESTTVKKLNKKIEKQTKMIKLLRTEQTHTHDKMNFLKDELHARTDSLMVLVETTKKLLKEEINENNIKKEEHNSSVERMYLLNSKINNMQQAGSKFTFQ